MSVWESCSSNQSVLLFGNSDQAVQKLVIGKSQNNCCAFVERNSRDCGNNILLSFEEMLLSVRFQNQKVGRIADGPIYRVENSFISATKTFYRSVLECIAMI